MYRLPFFWKLWVRYLSMLSKRPFKAPAFPLRFTFWRRSLVLFIVLESSNRCRSWIILLRISLWWLITWCMRQRCATASVNTISWLVMLPAWGCSPQIGIIYSIWWLLIASIEFYWFLDFLIIVRVILLQDSIFSLWWFIWFFILLVAFTLYSAINYLNKVIHILCILLLELFTILTLRSFPRSPTKRRTLGQIPCSIAHRMLILIISSKHASRDSIDTWRLLVEGQCLWELPLEFAGTWLGVLGTELGTHWVGIACCSAAGEVWHASLAHMSRSPKLSWV